MASALMLIEVVQTLQNMLLVDRGAQDSQQGKANQIHWAVTMVQQY